MRTTRFCSRALAGLACHRRLHTRCAAWNTVVAALPAGGGGGGDVVAVVGCFALLFFAMTASQTYGTSTCMFLKASASATLGLCSDTQNRQSCLVQTVFGAIPCPCPCPAFALDVDLCCAYLGTYAANARPRVSKTSEELSENVALVLKETESMTHRTRRTPVPVPPGAVPVPVAFITA